MEVCLKIPLSRHTRSSHLPTSTISLPYSMSLSPDLAPDHARHLGKKNEEKTFPKLQLVFTSSFPHVIIIQMSSHLANSWFACPFLFYLAWGIQKAMWRGVKLMILKGGEMCNRIPEACGKQATLSEDCVWIFSKNALSPRMNYGDHVGVTSGQSG